MPKANDRETGSTTVPKKSRRAFEDVAGQIRQQISAGQLKVGDKLAPERDLAKQFGVGRNAVREALRDLESKGILRLEPGRSGGSFIRQPNTSRVTHALTDLIDTGSISLTELTEARVLYMGLIVELACARATEADFQALEQNIDETDEFTRAGLIAQRTDRLGQFYTRLAESTENSVLVLIATSLSSIVKRFLDLAPESRRGTLDTTVPSRRRFIRYLRARDVEKARHELNDHLVRLHRSLEKYLAKIGQDDNKRVAKSTRPLGPKLIRERSRAAAAAIARR